jgi:hypothetical protein
VIQDGWNAAVAQRLLPVGNSSGTKKPQGLLRLGIGGGALWWISEDGRVQLVTCNLAVQLGFELAATFARDSALGRPFLDGLWCQSEEVA